MPESSLLALDFFRFLELVKSYTKTPLGADLVGNLRPLTKLEEISKRQELIREFIDIAKLYGHPPVDFTSDVREIVGKLSLGDFILEPKEFVLLVSFLKTVEDIVTFMRKVPKKGPNLTDLVSRLHPLPDVSKRIRRTISENGHIEDWASPSLMEIRRELYQKRMRVKRYLESLLERENVRNLLQDTYITMRNGRYVIPMKPNFNQALEGIVHDYSHSLKTAFVEPYECVPLNNEINVLEKEEKEEEERILKELGSFVRLYADQIEGNLKVLAEIDTLNAISIFSDNFNCLFPILTHQGDLFIEGAVNPILKLYKGDRVVPIDIIIEEERRAVVISGPNAGGKTVALKTLGLLTLISYLGFPIPSKSSAKIPVFNGIYALIGEEQDLSKELSSFTAHIVGIKEIIENVKGGELVLIDEIGGGTDPQEAAALSMAIMDRLVEMGCKVVVTTHLNQLKAYGFTKDFAKNVACAFDYEKMRPLYRLVYNTAGVSNAIHVARSVGLDESIIKSSLSYLGQKDEILTSLIEELKRKSAELDREKEEVSKLKETLSSRILSLKEKKDEILRKFEERAKARFSKIEEIMDSLEEELKKRDREVLAQVRRKMDSLRKTLKFEESDLSFEVGDLVKIRSLGTLGRIIGLDGAKEEYEVSVGNLRLKLKRKDLIKVDGKYKEEPVREIEVKVKEEPPKWELNLRGKTKEEAIEDLDRFLDQATLRGITKVRVLHGIGSGKLMQAVRDYLSKSRYVSSFKPDEKNPGITIVELR